VVSSGWLAAETTFGQTDQRKVGRALAASLALHGVGLAIVLFLMTLIPAAVTQSTPPREQYNLVFVKAEGPGGGGGGGGDSTPLPPRKVEMPATPPKAPAIDPVKVEVPPPPSLMAPIQTSSPLPPISGAVSGLSAAPSAGPGSGGGGGDGKGTGAGPGDGSGVGPGSNGGVGGGPMGPGSGAEPPTLLRGVDPRYTADAMQAKIQGSVELEVLVSPTGAVSDVKVSRSLDRSYGLDAQAIATAKQWIFRPARFKGQPVAYLVLIVMEFSLR
jgi:protein TonB